MLFISTNMHICSCLNPKLYILLPSFLLPQRLLLFSVIQSSIFFLGLSLYQPTTTSLPCTFLCHLCSLHPLQTSSGCSPWHTQSQHCHRNILLGWSSFSCQFVIPCAFRITASVTTPHFTPIHQGSDYKTWMQEVSFPSWSYSEFLS